MHIIFTLTAVLGISLRQGTGLLLILYYRFYPKVVEQLLLGILGANDVAHEYGIVEPR